ncbi:MATE family efflux transporter [Amycolatopsis aidingensis]|uniref:hypothetical protein n=1 Tax=Amycolatopsis aidingensis TaxID=2842453 RepID=UPI001E2D42F0|nr:hypothetical protein [Amycolatopsis aidingensis]
MASPRDRQGRMRSLLGKAGAPVLSQGITAGTSLLLQVVAARALGIAEFGAFALFLALLVSASALYTGFVGDGLAVLNRREPRTRAALAGSAAVGLTAACAIGVGAALVIRHGEPVTALLYAGMLVLWLVEETIRRLLMARLEFWKLVGNDLAYLFGTALALGAWAATAGAVTLPMLFAAMAVGAVTAIAAGIGQLPRAELRGLAPGWSGLRGVLSFAGWRAVQATLRPAALLAARVLVANLLSVTAVGVLEAGRLVVAPLQVVINGAGSFLLSGFAAGARAGGVDGGKVAARAAIVLTGVTVAGGLATAAFAGPLGGLLTGIAVSPWLVLGWVAYLAVWAAGLPYVTEVVSRKRSRAVFLTRLVDSVLGLVLAGAAVALGASLAAVPWLMAAGGLYSVLRLRALAVATRRSDPVTPRQDPEATIQFPPV